MTGYNHFMGMSNAALDAYDAGLKPLSKLSASDLKDVGWKGTLKQAKAVAKAGVWSPAEWHHSGGTWYNKVDFYNVIYLVENEIEPLPETEKLVEEERRVAGYFDTWIWRRGRKRKDAPTSFTGIKKGNWIELDGGGKKKADGNYIRYQYV